MCEYCGNERKLIHSESVKTENAIINIAIGFDEDGYLTTSTILQTAHTFPPCHLQLKTIVNICPMCGEKQLLKMIAL